jgi:hypothetical protein
VTETLKQALELQAVLLSARAQKTIAMTSWGSSLPGSETKTQAACWSCGAPGQFRGNCPCGRKEKMTTAAGN